MDRREFFLSLAAAIAAPLAPKVPATLVPSSKNNPRVPAAFDEWMPYMFFTGAPASKLSSAKITLPADFQLFGLGVFLPHDMPVTECERLLETTAIEFRVNGKLFQNAPLPYCMGEQVFTVPFVAPRGAVIEMLSSDPGPILILHGALRTS